VEQVTDPGKAFEGAMELARKVAAQPPLSVAMTKSPLTASRTRSTISPATWT